MGADENRATQPDFFSLQVCDARRFYLDLAPPPDVPLTVVCGGWEHCEADYRIRRSDFPYYSIEFVARGKGTLVLAGKEFALLPGTFFCYGPGISQDITTDAADPLLKYFVDFTGARALPLLTRCGLLPGHVGRVLAPGEVQGVLDDLIRDGVSDTGLTSPLCNALLEYLVLKITASLMPWPTGRTVAFATYDRCRQHIRTHCAGLKSLEQIARQCHVDPAYLCRLFRRYDHQTPYQLLMRLKMNLATERLQDPAVLVKQVAAELGFDDPFHFSRAFKRVFGVSPDAFRRLR
ncbi:MAG TPA: AraC family transcriptional regulator [Thermoguttaceae bacterium]|nr:AraC family transcriptional regulator [Thermoguttaceae bacterium]